MCFSILQSLQRMQLHSFYLALVIGLLATTLSSGVKADTPVPQISVSGMGEASLVPDTALLNLTVTREADTARAALDANSAAMAKVLDALRARGIESRDLQTSDFSIQPRYTRPPHRQGEAPQAPRIVGYTVRNSLTVRVRDLDKLGEVMDESVSLGVNEGGQITLINDDPSAALAEARSAAVKDALARAATLAEAAGVAMGGILHISEQSHFPRPTPLMARRSDMAMAAEAVPVASGENTYSVTVQISIAIE